MGPLDPSRLGAFLMRQIPPSDGEVVERGNVLPLGTYRTPDGRETTTLAFPQPMREGLDALAYALGYRQDPNAPAGYVTHDALNKGGQGLAESAMVGSIAARAPAGALRSGAGWRERLPKNESDFIDTREYERLLTAPYQEGASSRTTPVDAELPPVGTWRRSPSNLLYGRDIEELTTVPINDLIAKEIVDGKLDPTKRGDDLTYANWLAEGRRAPPIDVMQRADGSFVVMDGHRRLLAAKNAGRDNIEAWVSYDAPTGKVDADGNPITTSLTYELATNPTLAADPLAGAVPLAWRQPQEQQQGPMMGEQMGRRIPPEEEAQRQALIRYLQGVQ